MKTVLVTVSDDRFGRKEGGYKATQDKINHIVSVNPGFGIDQHKAWVFDKYIHLAQSLVQSDIAGAMLNNADPSRNGRLYKPLVIQHELSLLKDGDFLIYNDCSPEIWTMPHDFHIGDKYKLHILQGLCASNGGILTCFVRWSDVDNIKRDDMGKHTHANFTLDRCINVMGMQRCREDYMCASGMIVIQKTENTSSLIKMWLHRNSEPQCSAFGDPNIPDDYSYWVEEGNRAQNPKMGHRHDQSILSLLLSSSGFKFVDIPPGNFDGFGPYCFLQYARNDVDYRFIDGHVPFLNGDTVINQAGIELTVFDRRHDGKEWIFKVGKTTGSCHETTGKNIKLKI